GRFCFKQKTAYELFTLLEFRRVLFRSLRRLFLQKEIIATKLDVINDALKVIGSKLNVGGEERLKDFKEFDDSINEKIEDFFPGRSEERRVGKQRRCGRARDQARQGHAT